ncbi:MAG: DUF2461 domain-containing protein [Saprospiraceae bacterium]
MTILKDTLRFLEDLAAHNDREWFKANKPLYEAAQANMKEFVKAVEEELGKTDHLEGSKLFRIYRDVRFSKNKAPYKTYFGASFRRATNRLRGGYYLHIQPGQSFVGGGFWAPNPADLKRIRDEFVFDDKPIRAIIGAPDFVRHFGTLQGEELKTAPKGFDRNHPAIDLIRKKQFVVQRAFSDKEVTSSGFLSEVRQTSEAMRPYFDYMSEVLTTDLNGESILP